ncbi:MAG TPA: beta-ketoacyl synthase N-terminal-like domain-containing protein [Anaerolineae bacterium]|nr:beta-ketoacyl synthase N-terminal-like domain-containing protein [Anaerolineae bacterium]
MRDVSIIGIGQTSVGEHWETSLRHLALEAIKAAALEANIDRVDGLFVGNMLAGELSGQANLGALIADFVGLRGIEAVTVEAAGASGGAAVRQAYLAVAGGLMDFALVVGVEKLSDVVGSQVVSAQATATDSDYEAVHGATPLAIAALLMRRYMHEYDAALADFAAFSVNAHLNASTNRYAMYHNKISVQSFVKAPMVAEPINLFDAAPPADGAAAILLAPTAWAQSRGDGATGNGAAGVRIAASAAATDALAIADRRDPLWLTAAELSAHKAYQQAGISANAIHFAELHDGATVLAALALEACGFAERGGGVNFAKSGGIARAGRLPISTLGGLKGRGDPGGATGVYQIVEAAQQLRGQAGPNQITHARVGLAQSLGANGATAVTHILVRDE